MNSLNAILYGTPRLIRWWIIDNSLNRCKRNVEGEISAMALWWIALGR